MKGFAQLLIAVAVVVVSWHYTTHLKLLEANADKEYKAMRRRDCYNVFDRERAKWNNAQRQVYEEDSDMCAVVYKNSAPPKKECGPVPTISGTTSSAFTLWEDCTDNTFRTWF
jgi:hypothetical protein